MAAKPSPAQPALTTPGEIFIRCTGTETVDIKELVPFQGAFKAMTPLDKERFRQQVITQGIRAAATVWKHKGPKGSVVLSLLDGHQRQEVLLSLRAEGWKVPPVPVNFAPCKDEAEARRVVMALASTYGHVNADELSNFAGLAQLKMADLPAQFSFPDLDLGALSRSLAAAALAAGDDPEAPARPKKPITRPGDIWALGRHRVLCGDCTDERAVVKLLAQAAKQPHLMVTDPPYGVEYDPAWRGKRLKDGAKRATGKPLNDGNPDWTAAWRLFPGAVAYVWHAGKFSPVVAGSLQGCGFEIRNLIIWAKSRHTFGRGDYHHQHEPCWYMVRKGGTAHWQKSRSETTLWQIPTNTKNETGHSNQKPLECMARPIRNNSAPGDVVYDPFIGSGTTLVAAETLDRTCLGVELDQGYCDVIVQRWEKQTGKRAAKI